MIDATISISQLLHGLGYSTPPAAARARMALEEEGLTNARKKNINLQKKGRVEALRTLLRFKNLR